jgi:hypothetical protein
MDRDDERENAKSTMPAIERHMREQLLREHPSAAPAEIEDKLAQRMRRGMQPTTSTIIKPPLHKRPPRPRRRGRG